MTKTLAVGVLLAGVCLPGIAYGQSTGSAPAQAATPDANAAAANSGDIIVTAQRREERLQRVPISVSALSAAAIETRGIRSVGDLARVPISGLTVQAFAGNAQILLLDLRGVTTSDPGQGTVEPGVAMYEDDVYVSRAEAAGNTLADPERIEVLKGPQGTLFGRNAEGGLIRVVTKKPTGEFGGDFRVSIGDYGNRHYVGHLNLPEIAGFSVKLDVIHDDVDGYVRNGSAANPLVVHQNKFGAQNNTGFRGAVRWKPASGIVIDYSYQHLIDHVTNDYLSLTNPGLLAPTSYPQFTPPARTPDLDIHKFHDQSWTGLYQDAYRSTTDAHALAAQFDLASRLQLRSITSYRKLGFAGSNNLDGAPDFVNSPFLIPPGSTVASLKIVPAYANQTLGIPGTTPVYAISGSNTIVNGISSKAFSQEVQLIGSTSTLQYQFGGYYYHEDVVDSRTNSFTVLYTNPTYTSFLAINPFQLRGPAASVALGTGGITTIDAKARTLAAYGQATWSPEFADGRLHLTGGIRYTNDHKDFTRPFANGVAVNGVGAPFRASRVDPAATIAFDVTPDVNAYGRYATGYKAGGVSVRSPTFRSFGLESVKSYEVGLKTQTLHRQLQFNVALFENDIRNRQLNSQIDAVNAPSLVDTINTPGTTRIRGVETEIIAHATSDLTVAFNSSYQKFKLPSELLAINAALPFSAQGIYTVQNTPTFSTNMAVDWSLVHFDFGGVLTAHVDYAFASKVRGVGRIGITQYTWPIESHQGNARVTLDGIRVGPAKFRLSAYVTNFANEIYPIYDAPSAYYVQNKPRQFGVELGAKF